MIKVNLNSKEIQSKALLKSIFFLIVSLLLSANVLKAQIDIKSKIDAQTYSDYSKTIDLIGRFFPYSSNTITILHLIKNYNFSHITFK